MTTGHKAWVARSRTDRIAFLEPTRVSIRENLFLQLQQLLLERYRGIETEDRLAVLHLIEHKLVELNSKH